MMQDVRCGCGKIVCQVDEHTIVIKCRHCKRYVLIRVNGSLLLEHEAPLREEEALLSQEA